MTAVTPVVPEVQVKSSKAVWDWGAWADGMVMLHWKLDIGAKMPAVLDVAGHLQGN